MTSGQEWMMELWMDLLFGNWVGLLSVITVVSTLAIVVFILTMFYVKSRDA
jgi:uncharacterized membrane protein